MTVKLVILKTGQNIIADVQEMTIEEKVIGFYLNNPHIVNITNQKISDRDGESIQNTFDIAFFPWITLTKDKQIPISTDSVVTIVEPLDQLVELYDKKITSVSNNEERTDTGIDEQSDTDNAD